MGIRSKLVSLFNSQTKLSQGAEIQKPSVAGSLWTSSLSQPSKICSKDLSQTVSASTWDKLSIRTKQAAPSDIFGAKKDSVRQKRLRLIADQDVRSGSVEIGRWQMRSESRKPSIGGSHPPEIEDSIADECGSKLSS